jgi:hypothetical protein
MTGSYLVFPLLFLMQSKENKKSICTVLAAYGLVIFLLLIFFTVITKDLGLGKLYVFSYTFLEYLFLTSLLYLNIQSVFLRKTLIFSSVFFIAFDVFFYITGRIKRLDSIPVGVETILLFIFIFLFFYEQFKGAKSNSILHHNGFWICFGILVYLGGSFFFNILANHMEQEQVDEYFFLTYIADLIKNILFIVAMLIFVRQQNSKVSQSPSKIPYLDMI